MEKNKTKNKTQDKAKNMKDMEDKEMGKSAKDCGGSCGSRKKKK